MPQNLNDLRRETQNLGLSVQPGLKAAREPYLQALRAHHIRRDFPNGMPYEELHPMLCFDYWRLSSKEQDAIWRDSNDWIVQEKLNGCRLIVCFVKGRGVYAHSREVSARNFRRVELTSRLVFGDFIPDFSAVLDCEAICDQTVDPNFFAKKDELITSTLHATTSLFHMEPDASKKLQKERGFPLKLHIFDITSWEKVDLREKKLCERLSYLPAVREAIKAAQLKDHFYFVPIFFQGKRAVYNRILEQGGEGAVFKNLNSRYVDNSSRGRDRWVKIKRQVELDCFVSGFEQGKPNSPWCNHVTALIFAVNTEGGSLVIAKVSALPWEFRKKISLRDKVTGVVALNPECLGLVATVTGLELSRKARRLVHPAIIRWRGDLTKECCRYSAKDLERLRLGDTRITPMRIVGGST
jgi:ATP-dependent DNA ligase